MAMGRCPKCGRRYGQDIENYPDCGIPLHIEGEGSEELVSVYEPPDQMAALAAVARLEEQGIEAVAKSEQIAMYDGLAMMMRPRWGQVLVLGSHRLRAREILEDFLADSQGAEGTGDEPGKG